MLKRNRINRNSTTQKAILRALPTGELLEVQVRQADLRDIALK
jgi:hypothetical protein